MTADRRANRLPGATESNLAPVAQVRATAYKSRYGQAQPNKTRAARGPSSGNPDHLAALLAALNETPRRAPWQVRWSSPRGTYEQRFWARVDKADGCWNWTGPRNQFGYGAFSFRGRCLPAHRVSYALFRGIPDPGLCVCHRCDNRRCVRPDHLFAATHEENLADMRRKGRGVMPQDRRDRHEKREVVPPKRKRTRQVKNACQLRVGLA